MKVKLSIIILSYNTKDLTNRCLNSLFKNLKKTKALKSEIVVVDNGSKDGSIEMLNRIQNSELNIKNVNLEFKIIKNKENQGYPKGNNQGLKIVSGEYILFLNSDVIIDDVDFEKLIGYLEKNPQIGVITVKVNLFSNGIDPASHRGFPTIWNSFCYFSSLESLTKRIPLLNRVFGGYHLTNLSLINIHEIDSPSGAFYLTRKSILNKVGGFDQNFFMYGEDLDLSYRIKEMGNKIIYYPLFNVTHLKHSSGLKGNKTTRSKTKEHFFAAMKTFYKKHYESKHLALINKAIYFFIDILKTVYV